MGAVAFNDDSIGSRIREYETVGVAEAAFETAAQVTTFRRHHNKVYQP